MTPHLGAPDADAAYNGGTTTWTRTFGGGFDSGGTTVTFNASSNTGVIKWHTNASLHEY